MAKQFKETDLRRHQAELIKTKALLNEAKEGIFQETKVQTRGFNEEE